MEDPHEIIRLSKFLSYILRHHPEAIDLELDPHGWAHIPTLLIKAGKEGKSIGREEILEVVASGTKNRFSISEDEMYIRANYGHSVDVDLALRSRKPPDILYHGTASKNVESIKEKGLHSGGRNYVHLSAEKSDAVSVGQRHGKPVVLTVQATQMHEAGHRLYRAENEKGIWLVKKVPPEFISK